VKCTCEVGNEICVSQNFGKFLVADVILALQADCASCSELARFCVYITISFLPITLQQRISNFNSQTVFVQCL